MQFTSLFVVCIYGIIVVIRDRFNPRFQRVCLRSVPPPPLVHSVRLHDNFFLLLSLSCTNVSVGLFSLAKS